MKNTLLLFLCTIAVQITFAQNVKLQINDNETKRPIEFATVLLPDYKKSFVANEKGLFIVDSKKYNFPLNVIVEQFGFESTQITLQNNNIAQTVFLEPSSEILQELIIPPTNAKIKERIYGRTSEGSGNMKGIFRSYNEENKDSGLKFGMILNMNNKLKKIKKINWYITGIDFKRAIYGVEFYIVENGKPTKRIPHADIHFTITDKTKGWIIVNIEDLNIFLDGNKKVAAIIKTLKVEVKDGKENYLSTNVGFATSNNFVFKDSEYDDWQKIPMNYPFYITVDSYE